MSIQVTIQVTIQVRIQVRIQVTIQVTPTHHTHTMPTLLFLSITYFYTYTLLYSKASKDSAVKRTPTIHIYNRSKKGF